MAANFDAKTGAIFGPSSSHFFSSQGLQKAWSTGIFSSQGLQKAWSTGILSTAARDPFGPAGLGKILSKCILDKIQKIHPLVS